MTREISTSNVRYSSIADYERKPKFKKVKREWKGNVTEAFYNRLVPPLEVGKVKVRDLLIDGSREFGKSTKGCSIAEKVCIEKIAERECEEIKKELETKGYTWNRISVRHFKQVPPKFTIDPYQIVLIDDALRWTRKLKQEVKDMFEEIRHAFEKIVETGVIIVIWMVQEMYRIDREVREQMIVGIMLCNLKFSEWSRDDLKRIVGHEIALKIITLMGEWFEDKVDGHNDNILDNAILITHTWVGIVVIPPSTDPKWLPYKEITNEEGIVFEEPDIDEIQKDVFSSSGNNFDFPAIETGDANELVKEALERRKEIIQKLNLTSSALEERKFKAFKKHYIEGITLEYLADSFKCTSATFTNAYKAGGWFAQIRGDYLGHAIEFILTEKGQMYEGYTRIAGNYHIDLLHEGIGIEVKTRHRPNDNPKDDWLSSHTRKQLLNEKYSCSQGCKTIQEVFIFRVVTSTRTGNLFIVHKVVKKERFEEEEEE